MYEAVNVPDTVPIVCNKTEPESIATGVGRSVPVKVAIKFPGMSISPLKTRNSEPELNLES